MIIETLSAGNPGPMTGRGNNTYLVVQGREATLIDAGVGAQSHLDALAEALARHEATLQAVIGTHAHSDHVSGAPALATAYPGIRFRKMPWPERDAKQTVAWEPLSDGDRIAIGDDTLEVIHAPGHAPDHIVLWHASDRTAFVGDLVAPGASVMIPSTRGGDLALYMASLARLRQLQPSRLLPAHGQIVTDADRVLQAQINRRLQREQQVLAALDAGARTVAAITQSIYDGLSPALLPAAAENVQAHLAKLRHEGLVREVDGEWSR